MGSFKTRLGQCMVLFECAVSGRTKKFLIFLKLPLDTLLSGFSCNTAAAYLQQGCSDFS
jgi:hypothetical protein